MNRSIETVVWLCPEQGQPIEGMLLFDGNTFAFKSTGKQLSLPIAKLKLADLNSITSLSQMKLVMSDGQRYLFSLADKSWQGYRTKVTWSVMLQSWSGFRRSVQAVQRSKTWKNGLVAMVPPEKIKVRTELRLGLALLIGLAIFAALLAGFILWLKMSTT